MIYDEAFDVWLVSNLCTATAIVVFRELSKGCSFEEQARNLTESIPSLHGISSNIFKDTYFDFPFLQCNVWYTTKHLTFD